MSLSRTGRASTNACASRQSLAKSICVDVKQEPDGSKRKIADRIGATAIRG